MRLTMRRSACCAGDCNIYVRSHRAGERVMASITRFLTNRPQLRSTRPRARGTTGKAQVSRVQYFERHGSQRRTAPKSLAKFKGRVWDITAGHGASIWKGSKTCCLTSSDGACTWRSARLLACSQIWKPGFTEDSECISGDNGRIGTSDSWSFAASASRSSPHRLPPVRRRALANVREPAVQHTLRNHFFDARGLSEYWFLGQLNSVEPPRYGPVYARL
ncbi:hypothetical protein ABID59_007394 [Bradyrhizobium sp. S3.3.6]